jgi:hypothetical protein
LAKIVFILFSFLISIVCNSAEVTPEAIKTAKLGDHLTLRPNEIVPQTPVGAMWKVVKISSEKLKTIHGSSTNYSVPTLEVQLVRSDLKKVKDEISQVAVGGYFNGSFEATNYVVTLKSNMTLAIEELSIFVASVRKVYRVNHTSVEVVKDEELPTLREGYAWAEVSVVDERRDPFSGHTRYILVKTDSDLPDEFFEPDEFAGLAKDEKDFVLHTNCFTEMTSMVRH